LPCRCGRRWPKFLPDGAAADAVVNETDSGLDVLIRPHKRSISRSIAGRRWLALPSAPISRG